MDVDRHLARQIELRNPLNVRRDACVHAFPRLGQGGRGAVVQGDRPRGLARHEARDAVEFGLNERRFERLGPPLRSRKQCAEASLHPFVHLRHAAQLAIERSDVLASPLRNQSAIAPKKEVVVEVALGNTSDCVAITSLKCSLKRHGRSRRLHMLQSRSSVPILATGGYPTTSRHPCIWPSSSVLIFGSECPELGAKQTTFAQIEVFSF